MHRRIRGNARPSRRVGGESPPQHRGRRRARCPPARFRAGWGIPGRAAAASIRIVRRPYSRWPINRSSLLLPPAEGRGFRMGLRPAHGRPHPGLRAVPPDVARRWSAYARRRGISRRSALPLRDSGRDCSSGGRRNGIFPLLGRTRWSPQGLPRSVGRGKGRGRRAECPADWPPCPAWTGNARRNWR